MGAMLTELGALGLTLRALPDGRIHVAGPVTDAARTTIREHRAAILAELAANESGTEADLRNGTRAREAGESMRPCVACAALSPGGRCLAAWRGELPGFARTYSPTMTDRPQRCVGFQPGPDDPDQRSGRERWPWLLN